MQKAKWLNMLKVRAGYGVVGQQDGIGDYSYISNYFEGNYKTAFKSAFIALTASADFAKAAFSASFN